MSDLIFGASRYDYDHNAKTQSMIEAEKLRMAGYAVSDAEVEQWRQNGILVTLGPSLYDEWPWYKKLIFNVGLYHAH